MKGTTLSSTSSAGTPGERPAPDTDCSDVIRTAWTPKCSTSGARLTASAGGGAVGDGGNVAAKSPRTLRAHQPEVAAIHRRQQQRDVPFVAKGAGGAEDGNGPRRSGLKFARHVGLHRREGEVVVRSVHRPGGPPGRERRPPVGWARPETTPRRPAPRRNGRPAFRGEAATAASSNQGCALKAETNCCAGQPGCSEENCTQLRHQPKVTAIGLPRGQCARGPARGPFLDPGPSAALQPRAHPGAIAKW